MENTAKSIKAVAVEEKLYTRDELYNTIKSMYFKEIIVDDFSSTDLFEVVSTETFLKELEGFRKEQKTVLSEFFEVQEDGFEIIAPSGEIMRFISLIQKPLRIIKQTRGGRLTRIPINETSSTNDYRTLVLMSFETP